MANIVEMNFYYKISFNKYMYKSNFHIICDFLPNYLSMIDFLKHIHSAIVLTPLELTVQDWTYFEKIMLQY